MSRGQKRNPSPAPPPNPKVWVALAFGVAAVAGAVYYFGSRPSSEPAPNLAQPPAATSATTAAAPAARPPTAADVTQEDFLGAEACASCHQSQYDLWQHSTHGQAGGLIGDVRVIARFDGQPLQFSDATVIPTTNTGGGLRFVVERPGGMRQTWDVEAAIGGGHMVGGGTQTFFTKFNDGTVRFLPFDFIRDEHLWFVQLRKDNSWAPISRDISLDNDLANWPPHRVLGTLVDFSNCQNCHGSQVSVGYDATRRRYDTRFTSLRINCESCHGPGRRHVEIMNRPGHETLADIGMAPLALLDKNASLEVCFQCHAHKVSVREGRYLPGNDLHSFFSVKLSHFWNNPWLPDGRVAGFGYQANHLYSDCYLNGSMTCTDCHDPHSQRYRDNFGRALPGRFDNGQCTGCHASKGLDSSSHSHHAAGSEGDRCTSCHMPFLQHQTVGRVLKFTRSDHTIPIPRPGFDEQYGIENACQKCHADHDLGWQVAKVREWYGETKPHHPLVQNLLDAASPPDLATAAELLLASDPPHPMAQAAGLSQFILRFLRPGLNAAEPVVTQRLEALAGESDLDLQALALMALQIAWDAEPSVETLVDQAMARLRDAADPLRARWAVAADHWGTIWGGQGNLEEAIRCFQASIKVQPDNIVSLSNLALAYLRSDMPDLCVSTLQNAIALQPSQAALHFQLAQTYVQLGRLEDARQAIRAGLQYAPDDPAALRMQSLLEE